MRWNGSTKVRGLTFRALLGTGQVCHPQGADLRVKMFNILDSCLSLPSHDLQAGVLYKSSLAHRLQPLFTWKAEASRLSLSEHLACSLQEPLLHPGDVGQVDSSLTPTAIWVHGSLGPLSSLVSKLLCLLGVGRGEKCQPRAQQASLPK